MDIKNIRTKDLSKIDIEKLEKFISDSQNVSSPDCADAYVKIFLDSYQDWNEIVEYMLLGKNGDDLYGAALSAYSHCLYESTLLSKTTIHILCDEAKAYEQHVKYFYSYKYAIDNA